MIMKQAGIGWRTLLATGVLLAPTFTVAGDAPPVDPAVRAAAERFGTFMKKADSLHATVRVEQTGVPDHRGVSKKSWTVSDVTLKRPFFFRETTTESSTQEAVGAMTIADGKTFWSYSPSEGDAITQPYGEGMRGSSFLGGLILARFHAEADPAAALLAFTGSPRLLKEEKIDGADCQVLGFNAPPLAAGVHPYPATLAVRKDTGAPVRATLTVTDNHEIVTRFSGIETSIGIPEKFFVPAPGIKTVTAEELANPPEIAEFMKTYQAKADALSAQMEAQGVPIEEIGERVKEALDNDPELIETMNALADSGIHVGIARGGDPSRPPEFPPGADAPDFEATDVLTGKPVRLSDFRGKTVLLHFWGTG